MRHHFTKLICSKQRLLTVVGLSLLSFGLIGSVPELYTRWRVSAASAAQLDTSRNPPAGVRVSQSPLASTAGKPVSLHIPALGLTLPITEGYYDAGDKSWTLSSDKAHYAVMSALPGSNAGTTFVYGHNRPGVFASLYSLMPGSEAVITTSDNYRFIYALRGSHVTVPVDTSALRTDGQPSLTILTCSGVWFQNRQLFDFALLRAEKIR